MYIDIYFKNSEIGKL